MADISDNPSLSLRQLVIVIIALKLAIMMGGKATINSLPYPKSICPHHRATKYEIITPKMIRYNVAMPAPY